MNLPVIIADIVVVIPCDKYEGTWRYYTSGCFLFDSNIVTQLFFGVVMAAMAALPLIAAMRQPKAGKA